MSTTESLPAGVRPEWLPKPEDELLHEPFGNEDFPWKETFFITLHDVSNALSINMHQTVSANRSPDTRQAIGLSQGDRSVSVVCREDGQHSDESIGNSQSRLEIVNLSWDSDHTLRWVGEIEDASFDLTIKGQHWASLWDTMHKGFYAGGEGDGQVYCHAEQIITATGTITWKGEEPQQFNGMGWRDRGWGRRKTQLMWNMGWDLMGGIMPDGTAFSMISLRQHNLPEPAPFPLGGWYADEQNLVPCIGGTWRKEATSVILGFDFEYEDGKRLAADVVRSTGRVAVALQEAEFGPEVPNMAIAMQDTYALMRDKDGVEFPVFTQVGFTHRIDVTREAQFIHAGNPPVKG